MLILYIPQDDSTQQPKGITSVEHGGCCFTLVHIAATHKKAHGGKRNAGKENVTCLTEINIFLLEPLTFLNEEIVLQGQHLKNWNYTTDWISRTIANLTYLEEKNYIVVLIVRLFINIAPNDCNQSCKKSKQRELTN